MRCCIADLIVEIPEAGGMAPRCRAYLTQRTEPADIRIYREEYDLSRWKTDDEALAIYMESGVQFYGHLLRFNGMLLHSSAVEMDGKAYLFSGPSGMGKSTHTRLWQQQFGDAAQIFNDDKPALRLLDGHWYAYGTPWCGKDGINQNRKVSLGGVCFLKRGNTNRIRRLSAAEAVPLIYGQTMYRLHKPENALRLMSAVDALVRRIPIFELECRPDPEAVILSSRTMTLAAQEEIL